MARGIFLIDPEGNILWELIGGKCNDPELWDAWVANETYGPNRDGEAWTDHKAGRPKSYYVTAEVEDDKDDS